MSNFLKDLLATDANVTTDLFNKISKLKSEVVKLKSLTKNDFMKDKYIELEANLKPDKLLLNKSEELVCDMKILQRHINDQTITKLTSSSTELQNLSVELKEYNYSILLSDYLLKVYQALCYIETFKANKQNAKQYTNMAKTLVELHNLIIKENSEICQLNIYTPLKEEYFKLNDNFIQKLAYLWHENIHWDDKKDSLSKNLITLTISCQNDKLSDIIEALDSINKLQKYLEQLSSKLLQNFIYPIIHFRCLVNTIDDSFSLEILDKKQVPAYTFVLDTLKLLFEFLQKHLDILVESKKHLLTELSNYLFPEFSTLLTNDCIYKILPTSTVELETFKTIVLEVEAFQNYLIDIKFIPEGQNFLSNYTNNIDELYIDKKIEKLLETARNIMKKDLHDSIRYKPESSEEFQCAVKNLFNDYNSLLNKKYIENLFYFPECQISNNAQEVLHLVEQILEETFSCPEKYLPKLFYIARNIFEMYATLVPEIHKSYLDTIPQQVALFHNNCLFLSHHLLMLLYKHNNQTKVLTKNFSLTYADQHLFLREVGFKYFLNHMKYQKDIIFNILRESGLTTVGQMPELPLSVERALRQCIRQLELLKTVWIEILPFKMYHRVMGCIIYNMIDDIITKVISVEDIPASIASELVTLFNMVTKRIPQIFSEPQSIEQFVQNWRKLKELIIILGASLKEIEDRWADSKGPLGREFSPQHVKQLIRALFQNTERRSHLLSKIKEK